MTMTVEFRKQVVVNDGAGGMGTVRCVVHWPAFLPVPQVGDHVEQIRGEHPLGVGFTVDNRTITAPDSTGPGPWVILTEFIEPEPGETLTDAIERILADLPSGWEVEQP